MVGEIEIRAERKIGELLKVMPKNKGGRPKDGKPVNNHDWLSDLCITKNQSSVSQKLAGINEKKGLVIWCL